MAVCHHIFLVGEVAFVKYWFSSCVAMLGKMAERLSIDQTMSLLLGLSELITRMGCIYLLLWVRLYRNRYLRTH